MPDKDFTVEDIKHVAETPNPFMEGLSELLRVATLEAVHFVAGMLASVGVNPTQLPTGYFIQAALVEAEDVFGPVSREDWIKLYDESRAVKALFDDNPGLKEEMRAVVRARKAPEEPVAEAHEDDVDAFLKTLFGN